MNFTDAELARTELARAVSGGHPETIARTAASNVWPLYTSHSELLIAAVVDLPSALLDRYPILRVLHPMTPVLARTARPFKPVMYSQDARTMTPDELDFLTFAQMIGFRFGGDTTAALACARKLEERLLQMSVDGRDRVDGPLWFFHHQIGTTLLSAGDTNRALLEFATARQLASLSAQPYAERMALGRIAIAHAIRGALDDAERALAEARSMPEVETVHANAAIASENAAAALIAVDRMSADTDDVLAASVRVDSIELNWPFVLLARCRAYLALHRPEDALEAAQFAASAHAAQRGSFGADVIAAMSIEALIATGDATRAWRTLQENPKVGVLTQFAAVHLALYDSRFDIAAQELQLLAGDETLGPAQRAEFLLLSGWLEFARSGELDKDTARQIARIARSRDRRRLLAIMPRQLVDRVREALDGEMGAAFAAATCDLVSADLQTRPSLTVGELRVLNALPAQLSTARMASSFHVSPNTVKSQLRSLYRKLGCSTRDDAIRVAGRLRLLSSVSQG